MPVHTKRRLTRSLKPKSATKEKTISWREVAKKELAKHSEGGQMLRGARYKNNITQKQLADAIGVSQHHISEMENGKRPIGKEMAKRLSDFFKTDYRVFL